MMIAKRQAARCLVLAAALTFLFAVPANAYGDSLDIIIAGGDSSVGTSSSIEASSSAEPTSPPVETPSSGGAAAPSTETTTPAQSPEATETPVEPEKPLQTIVQDSDSRIAFAGGWTYVSNASASGGRYRYSATKGASAVIAFYGTGVTILGPTGPKYGYMTVSVDGVHYKTVSCYASSYRQRTVVCTIMGLAEGTHSVIVRVAGTKPLVSSGVCVGLDAFVVERPARAPVIYKGFSRAQEDSKAIFLSGFSKRTASASSSGGGYIWSSAAGATVTAYVRGSNLRVIGALGPSYGMFQVFIDGVSKGVFSCYAPSYTNCVTLYEASGLSTGVHTLKLVVLGTKSGQSSGTKVVFDAAESWSVAGTAKFYYGFQSIQDANTRLKYYGTWSRASHSSASGGGYSYASKAGARMVSVFRGTEVVVYGATGPRYGKVQVYIDGVSKGVVDCYSATQKMRTVIFTASGLSNQIHAITLKVLGTKSSASAGTGVVIDAIQAVSGTAGRIARFDGAPSLTYSWSTYMCIDKSDFRLYWVKNGVLRGVYPVAHGKVSTPTPSAIWRIDAKYKTDPNGIYGPRKMRLYRKTASGYVYTRYGIHGTNEPWVIGTRASHGCIRMYNSDVLKLWPEVPLRTMVVTRN